MRHARGLSCACKRPRSLKTLRLGLDAPCARAQLSHIACIVAEQQRERVSMRHARGFSRAPPSAKHDG